MEPIKVMVNGLPGKVSAKVAEHIANDSGLALLPYALTGPDISDKTVGIGAHSIQLTKPDERESLIARLKEEEGRFICVDFTHPTAVNDNATFYCNNELPFVMGTTGGDRQALADTVSASKTCAVIAPNMAKQIVAFQAMMAYAADSFPGMFEGYRLEIKESHQQGKADTSGTAKAMIEYFNRLGIPFNKEEIIMERDPEIQKTAWQIPEAYLDGHGWHTYTLRSDDDTVMFQFTHNVNGRDIYAKGTIDGIRYLSRKLDKGDTGRVFSMIDVLKGI
jgi:4-hydroxy-tetrahydrodipicolinate reductase